MIDPQFAPSMGLAPDQLKAIEARLKAAKPGPWMAANNSMMGWAVMAPPMCVAIIGHPMEGGRDAALIANAPTDIAALVAEVRRLQGFLVMGDAALTGLKEWKARAESAEAEVVRLRVAERIANAALTRRCSPFADEANAAAEDFADALNEWAEATQLEAEVGK